MASLSRRQFTTALLCAGAAPFCVHCQRKSASAVPLASASGEAFGTEVHLTLAAPTDEPPSAWFDPTFAEIHRLESLFTLYDPASPLRQLNDRGFLDAPPPELISVLKICDQVHRLTSGAFDPTVQPLWELYESHFATHPTDTRGPSEGSISRTRERVGWDKVIFDETQVRFDLPGMKLTLNGIAPGFTADAIAAFLSKRGISHALIDCGEFRSLGAQPDGSPWEIAIRGPGQETALAEAKLTNDALATSAGYATAFDLESQFHHLFSPEGKPFSPARQVISVQAPTAALADALATAGGVMEPAAFSRCLEPLPGVTAIFHDEA